MFLSFSVGTFLSNYDVINRKLKDVVIYFIVRKRAKIKSMESTDIHTQCSNNTLLCMYIKFKTKNILDLSEEHLELIQNFGLWRRLSWPILESRPGWASGSPDTQTLRKGLTLVLPRLWNVKVNIEGIRILDMCRYNHYTVGIWITN